MAQILVRNIEDGVKEALRSRAKRHGTSLEEYVRDVLRAEAVRREPEVGLGTQIANLFKDCPYEMPDLEALRDDSWRIPDFSGPEFDPQDEPKR
jgi:plasmid stability protein